MFHQLRLTQIHLRPKCVLLLLIQNVWPLDDKTSRVFMLACDLGPLL